MKRLLAVTLILLSAQGNAGPKLEPLLEEDIAYGCGCSFQLHSSNDTKRKTILQWELGERANIRIDGRRRMLELKELKNDGPPEAPWKVGDKTVFELRGDGVAAIAACTVTEICPPDHPACETTFFTAKLTVRTEKGETIVNTHASCGC